MRIKKKKGLVTIMLIMLLVLMVMPTSVKAAEAKYSVYTIKDNIKRFYPCASIKRDNRGYYFTYKNNGYFECYLGKSKNMTLQEFSRKLGGGSSITVKTQNITKSEQTLKKVSVGLLAAYFTKDVHWLASWVVGAAADKATGKILRQPGKYRYTTEVCMIKIRNGALKGCAYEKSFYIPKHMQVEKYDKSKRRYVTLYNSKVPRYELMTN